jgi:hypothetical protein
MSRATPLYHEIISRARARIQTLGWPMWRVDEEAGLQAGYTAKMLHPDTASGRIGQWDVLEKLMSALYPHGYDVVILAHPQPLERFSAKPVKVHRQMLAGQAVEPIKKVQLYAFNGRKGGKRSLITMTKDERVKRARKAGRIRWRKWRELKKFKDERERRERRP